MLKYAMLASLLGGVALAAPAQAQTLRLLNSWDQNFPATKTVAVPLAEAVKAASNGALTIAISGPETVPSFEQLQPVQAGAFQLLMTHGAYHYGAFGMGMATDAIKGDAQARRDSGVWAALDQAYQKKGLKMIALPVHGEGYQFILRRGLSAEGDLKGAKIRTSPAYIPLINALGGTPVTLPPSELYAALQKGVVDGAAWSTVGAITFRLNEVAGVLARPTFGNSTYMVLMNLEAFNKLAPDKQKVLLDAGEKIEREAKAAFSALSAQEEKDLVAKGMKIQRFPDKHAAMLDAQFAEGLWSLAEKKEGDAAKALRAFAKSKGMTN